MNEFTASDIVEGAIETVEAGWCQGSLAQRDPDTDTMQYCTIGAVESSKSKLVDELIDGLGGFTGYYDAVDRGALKWIGDNLGEAYHHITAYVRDNSNVNHIAGWNDAPERTKEDVVEMLTTVAKDLRNQGK